MKCIPEHVIVSDTIEANGYREVTLRLRPERVGKVFLFLIVEGGLNKYPELQHAWKTGIEVEGETYKDEFDTYIKVSKITPLSTVQKENWRKQNNDLWSNQYFTNKED